MSEHRMKRKRICGACQQRICMACGRALEIGEQCACNQPVVGMPKDGLRARCPKFEYRSSYRGKHFIGCDGRRIRFASQDTRNEHYRDYCCGNYAECLKMNTEGNK